MDKQNISNLSTETGFLNRLKGLMIGGSLGDALGAPHEFKRLYKENKYSGKLEHKLWVRPRFSKIKYYYDIGQVTDDTEMSMCIASSLLENNLEYNEKTVVEKYMEWANCGTRSMGINTRNLFKGIKTYKGYTNRTIKIFSDPEKLQSNGALMRCGLLSLFHFKQFNRKNHPVIRDCGLTNPSNIAKECSWILSIAIYNALLGKSKEEIIEKIISTAKETVVIDHLKYAIDKKQIDISTTSKGWCVFALYISVYVFCHYNDYASSINYIIKLFGDTDTNACIAGYLLGAFYGYNEMILDTVTNNNIKILMQCDTQKATNPRHPRYLMANYVTPENLKLLSTIVRF